MSAPDNSPLLPSASESGSLSPAPVQTPPPESLPWTFLDVVRIAILTIVAIFFFTSISFSIAAHRGGKTLSSADAARDPKIILPGQAAAYLLALAFMVAVVRGRGRPFWQSMRWSWPSIPFGYLAAGLALALAVQFSSAFLPIPKSLPIEQYFTDAAGVWLMAIFGVTLAPLMEELFFRGFLYPVLARRLPLWLAISLTALGFALIHASQLALAWAPLLLLFGVGLVLTITRARTASVATSFLIHVGYNATLFTLLYLTTDHFRHLEKAT